MLAQLKRQNDDDNALLFRVQHLVGGVVRYARAKHAHVVKVDNWFGARWRCFAGSLNGKELHPEDRLAVPPFAPKRVLLEASFRRTGDQLRKIETRRLHASPIVPTAAMPHYLDKEFESGIFIWYSGKTATQDRASLMAYEIEKGAEQRSWWAEFQKRDGVWSISSTVGTSVNELNQLETAYGDRLAPLFQDKEELADKENKRLWQLALDACYGKDVARATILIEKYAARKPENKPIRLLRASNLAQRRQFEAAEEELRATERALNSPKWRETWLREWAELHELKGDLEKSADAFRELTSIASDNTPYWIMLGGCLARLGHLKEAEAIHRHATELEGDPDEAFLNLGLVLRAMGRFEESAEAFESALQLCPDYPEATAALKDVRAAIELRDELE